MTAYRRAATAFGRAPIRALRLGHADEAVTYVRQLTGWTRSMRWTSLRGVDYLAAAAHVTTPTVPFVGAGDWMCTPTDATSFAGHLQGASRVRVVGRIYGDALDPDHFTLFTRGELRALSSAWASSRHSGRSSPRVNSVK